nr:aminoglycoside phosphotransferase family protein [Paenibacillus glycanilyticus]
MTIEIVTLRFALSQMFNTEIIAADYQTLLLQGGTVGTVNLVTGIAESANGEKMPYRIVQKVQNKWERYGDPGSWRREYDLYTSELGATFSESFRWPNCYYAEINAEENECQLWLEYIDGVSGLDLTGNMYEKAALELGRYQGKLFVEQPAVLQNLTNLSQADFIKNNYFHYRSWPVVYDYIRSKDCEFPQHLQQMLIDIDLQAEEIFARIEKLPLVLCHRDFWVTNIIYADGKIALIDWDTTGRGYMGEDLASLIADEADINHMVEYYQRCVPAYYKGFSEHVDVSHIADDCVYEMILLIFGYKLVERYLYSAADESKKECVQTLQKIYEMKI